MWYAEQLIEIGGRRGLSEVFQTYEEEEEEEREREEEEEEREEEEEERERRRRRRVHSSRMSNVRSYVRQREKSS